MRLDDEYHAVEITVLDTNLSRKCSYKLDKKNKEFHKSKRVIGYAYKDNIPYLISINIKEIPTITKPFPILLKRNWISKIYLKMLQKILMEAF